MTSERSAPILSSDKPRRGLTCSLLVYLFIPLILLTAGRAFAHHSFPGAYDARRALVMEGVVSEFLFRNPHTFILLDVTDAGGNVTTWAVDMPPAMALVRGGITPETVQPGDELMVLCSPSRDGRTTCGIGETGGVYRGADDWRYNRDPRNFEEPSQ